MTYTRSRHKAIRRSQKGIWILFMSLSLSLSLSLALPSSLPSAPSLSLSLFLSLSISLCVEIHRGYYRVPVPYTLLE